MKFSLLCQLLRCSRNRQLLRFFPDLILFENWIFAKGCDWDGKSYTGFLKPTVFCDYDSGR